MIDVSDFMRNHYIILTTVFVAFVIGFHFFRQTYYGQIWLHRISLKIPVFGWMEKQMNTILFISSLSLLLNSGILMLEALVITAKVVPNIHFKRDIIRMKNEVEA
jgi:type IV pilus assembly protein PilC